MNPYFDMTISFAFKKPKNRDGADLRQLISEDEVVCRCDGGNSDVAPTFNIVVWNFQSGVILLALLTSLPFSPVVKLGHN